MKLIESRHSSRGPFDAGRVIPSADMEKILEAARWAPTAHNMQNFEIVVVDDKNILAAISGIKSHPDLTFIRENYQQLSFTEDELRRRKVGVLGTMFPKSWQTPDPSPEEINSEDWSESRSKQIVSCSATLFVLYDPSRRAPASEGDFLGIISLGCVMENMWLMANSLGIGVHIVSSLSGKEAAKEITKMLNVPANFVIAFGMRLGYPVASVHYLRVRRDKDDFAHHNEFKK
ncbi:MAG: nitroreductase family protein [Bryobacteraceae bacterium]